VRAFALIGIALVNVSIIAYPGSLGYLDGGLRSAADSVAHFVVSALFLFKSYTLFSFMFGAGFGQQMNSATRDGASFAGRYTRRIVGLVLLGIVNVACLFFGDILLIYALLGTVLLLFRNASPEALVLWAKILMICQIVVTGLLAASVWVGVTMAPEDMAAEAAALLEDSAEARAAFGSESFAEAAAYRVRFWAGSIPFVLILQGFGAFAFFLFGLAARRIGLLSQTDAPLWGRCRRVYLPLGLFVSAIGALLSVRSTGPFDPSGMLGLAITTLGSPFVSAGYLGLLAGWANQPQNALQRFLARAGSASLTAYLLQGLLLSWVFSGYGLGLFAKLGAAACTAVAAAVAVVTIVLTSIWRTRFAHGPVESLLRAWTYLGAAPRR
jgi:uncharacterized protein